MKELHIALCFLVAIFTLNVVAYQSFSGVYPHLAMTNNEDECGTGAVVPWAGRLWVITYGPHMPVGSSDKLYEIDESLNKTIRTESVGGTPANRIIHRETNKLLIGPYIINAQRDVTVLPPWIMPGRLTGAARHLVEPDRKVYVATMETGLYEVDMVSGEVTTLIRENGKNDAAIERCCRDRGGKMPSGWQEAPKTVIPGYHSKGLCSGFGKVFVSNNGEDSDEARRNPFTTSGVLADWSRIGDDWRLIRRNQFTEIATKDGIYGNEHPEENPIWALGWDARSVILGVNEDNVWRYYRLPKASHSYDGAHGWNTEWPRIREIGEGDDFLATMHGTFWRFPSSFSSAKASGIRPRSTYLKVIGDFCRWGERIVFGCDDHAKSEFLNTRALKGKNPSPRPSESNLWFVEPLALDNFGPCEGKGAVWVNDKVSQNETSDAFLFAGYERKWLWVNAPVKLEFDLKGTGKWSEGPALQPGGHRLSGYDMAEWVRLRALADCASMTAVFHYGAKGRRNTGNASFQTAAPIASRQIFGNNFPDLGAVVSEDAASIIIMDKGTKWRFPRRRRGVQAMRGRVCREVSTERDLLKIGEIFYELPADNAGGIRFVHPIAATARQIDDFDTWKGILVLKEGDKFFAGVADDLWRLGELSGIGGPWHKTFVKANAPSDPYLMNGFTGYKSLEVTSDKSTEFTLEADVTGNGVWMEAMKFSVEANKMHTIVLPEDFAAYWVRIRAADDCIASALFTYADLTER